MDTLPEWEVLVYDTSDNLVCVCTDIESAEFSFERIGGCGAFSLTLPDTSDQDAYFLEDYKVVLRVKDPDAGTWSTWYTGSILSGTVYTSKPEPQTIRGMGYIRTLDRRYISVTSGRKDYGDVPLQANYIIYGIWQQWLKGVSPILVAETDFEAGAVVKYPSSVDRSISSTYNGVVGQIDPIYTNGLGCTWGVDEAFHLFAKPVPAATVVEMDATDPRIDSLRIGWDASDKVNALFIDGGDAIYPNLLANPSFAESYSVTKKSTGLTYHYRFFHRINGVADTSCGWCIYPSSGTAHIYHYDFLIDGYSQGGVTYSDQILPIHDNNLVYFDGASYSGSAALWSNKFRIEPYTNDQGDTEFTGTLAFGAQGRYYDSAGTVLKVQVYGGPTYGTETPMYLQTSDPNVTIAGDGLSATIAWSSGQDFDLKRTLIEFYRTTTWSSYYYWFRLKVSIITNNRPLWADGFVITPGLLGTDQSIPASALTRIMDSSYATYFSDVPVGGYAVEGQVSNPAILSYSDAKRNYDMFMEGAGGTKIGGTVSLANYPYRIAPWEGAFIVRNVPDKRDGTRSDRVFPMENASLRIGLDGRFGWSVTLGDRLPDDWQYVAQGWAKTAAQAAVLRARSKKPIVPTPDVAP